ncbi:PstS family phosphate ABC transporter substrate-binding protein [Marinobacter sediminum]|uniref:PstS family phosphate ABC transporter substrate-binding protein n=1 Tax=Marinobacter sediminum TaxID=256323 RepID=UPI0035617701
MTTTKSTPRSRIGITILMLFFLTTPHATLASDKPLPAINGTLYVGGTGASIGILKILTEAYEQHYPSVKTVVFPSLGSGGGIKALEADKLTVSFSSRALKDEERERGLNATFMLRTPLVMAAHPHIDRETITVEQIASMLSGDVTTWDDGTLVRPVLRPLKDADTRILMGLDDRVHDAMLAAHERIGKNVAATDSHAADELESIEGALGVTSLVLVRAENRRINVLSLEGVSPTLENLESGQYPIEKTIYAVTRPNSSELADSFLAFLKSDKARELILANGGLPGDR